MILDADGRRKVDEPLLEDFQLIFRRIDKHYTHSDSLLHVESLRPRLEHPLIAGDTQFQDRPDRQWMYDINKTALAAYFGDPAREPQSMRRVGDLGGSDKGVARICAPVGT